MSIERATPTICDVKDWLTTILTIAGLIVLAFVIRSLVLKRSTAGTADDVAIGVKPADKEQEAPIAGEIPGEPPTDPDIPMEWESKHHPFIGFPEEPAPVDQIKISAPRARAKHPHDDMVRIPGGDITVGQEGIGLAEPAHQAYVGAFMLDRYEVTCEQYRQFIVETDHPEPALADDWAVDYSWRVKQYPEGTGDHPVTLVSFIDATKYCRWAGKRIPTGAEWEKAARGTDKRRYPWGNEWDGRKSHTVERITGPLRALSEWTAIVEGDDDEKILRPFPVGS
ncbi:MAG: sulfatase activating formylglycine-generating enzyme, partial [Myxococcota bacterium]